MTPAVAEPLTPEQAIAFLRSVIASGERLTAEDNERLDATLDAARAAAPALDEERLARALQNVMGIWAEMPGGAIGDAERIAAEYARLGEAGRG